MAPYKLKTEKERMSLQTQFKRLNRNYRPKKEKWVVGKWQIKSGNGCCQISCHLTMRSQYGASNVTTTLASLRDVKTCQRWRNKMASVITAVFWRHAVLPDALSRNHDVTRWRLSGKNVWLDKMVPVMWQDGVCYAVHRHHIVTPISASELSLS